MGRLHLHVHGRERTQDKERCMQVWVWPAFCTFKSLPARPAQRLKALHDSAHAGWQLHPSMRPCGHHANKAPLR